MTTVVPEVVTESIQAANHAQSGFITLTMWSGYIWCSDPCHQAPCVCHCCRAGLSGQGLLDDFADEVADLVQLSQGQDKGGKPAAAGGSGLADLFGRQRLSQKFGADLTSDRKKFRSGDEDVPTRNPIHERRSQFDATAARRAAAAGVGGEDDNDDMDFDYGAAGKSARKRGAVAMGEEDEFYAASKAARQASNAARQDKHKVPELLPPLPDATASGQRKITKEIEKNRGLTPHR